MPFHRQSLIYGFQCIRRHQGPLHHLQHFRGILRAVAHLSGKYSSVAEIQGQLFRRFAVGSKVSEQSNMAVIPEDLRTFIPVVFLQQG